MANTQQQNEQQPPSLDERRRLAAEAAMWRTLSAASQQQQQLLQFGGSCTEPINGSKELLGQPQEQRQPTQQRWGCQSD